MNQRQTNWLNAWLLGAGILILVLAAPAYAYRILFAPWPGPDGSWFGAPVVAVGDVDANGLPDFVVGDDAYSEGRAYLYLPALDGTLPAPVILDHGTTPSLFGKETAAAGDLNHDGYDDFLITSENIRAVVLFLGAATPAGITRVVIPSPNDERSTSVAGVGDVNRDGYDDFLVGALWDEIAWLYYGGATVDATPDLVLSGSGHFGITVSPLGDFNGDGYADFAVGAPGYAVDGIVPGAVFLYLGGAVPDAEADFVVTGRQHQENFGRPLRLAGDLNGDGRRDLLVAAPAHDGPAQWSGRLDVFYLTPDLGAVQGPSIYGEESRDIWYCDGNADIDLDGVPDVVCAPGLVGTGPIAMFSGAALVGQSSVSTSWADWRLDTPTTGLASIGDLNGDGYRELLVGNGRDVSRGFGGRAFVLAGGHRVLPRFRLASASAEPDAPFEVILYASLETTDPQASVPLAALDLELAYDSSLVTFLGAESVTPADSWVYAANAAVLAGRITIAMATNTPPAIGAGEQPLLRLRFQAGPAAGQTTLDLAGIEAHSSADLPLWPLFEPGTLTIAAPTSVPTRPLSVSVRAYPNPFNPMTTLEWTSPVTGPAELTIFDARGRRVWRQTISQTTAGVRTTRWTGTDTEGRAVAAGTYLLEVRSGTWRARTRLTLVR